MLKDTMVTQFLSISFFFFYLFSFYFHSKPKQKKSIRERTNMFFTFINTCICGFCTCQMITFRPCYHCKTLHLTLTFFIVAKKKLRWFSGKKDLLQCHPFFFFFISFFLELQYEFFMIQNGTFLFSYSSTFFFIILLIYFC